jgi:hypothetical protein
MLAKPQRGEECSNSVPHASPNECSSASSNWTTGPSSRIIAPSWERSQYIHLALLHHR